MRDGDGGWETRGLEVGWRIVEGLGSLDAGDFAVGWWAGLKVFVGGERLWVGCCNFGGGGGTRSFLGSVDGRLCDEGVEFLGGVSWVFCLGTADGILDDGEIL